MHRDTFYDTDLDELTLVAGDIETTGLCGDDEITALTLSDGDEFVVFLNAGEDASDVSATTIQTELVDTVPVDATFRGVVCGSSAALLDSAREYITESYDAETTLFVFYNGETWRGGFDLSFIRSVCLREACEFPFTGYGYLDLYPLFGKRGRVNVTRKPETPDLSKMFNKGPLSDFADWLGLDISSGATKAQIEDSIVSSDVFSSEKLEKYCESNGVEVPTETPSDLVGVYREIASLRQQASAADSRWNTPEFDPLGPDESHKAVELYENNEYVTVLRHNVADVFKTHMLTHLLGSQVGLLKSDLDPKFF